MACIPASAIVRVIAKVLGAGGPITPSTSSPPSPPPPVDPFFATQPMVSPASGQVGQTFNATPGMVLNGAVTSREWRFGGSVVDTDTSYTALAAGTLTYQEFSNSVASSRVSISVIAAAVAKFFGMNLAGGEYYSGVRMFSNLARAHIPQANVAGNGLAQSDNLPYSATDQTTGRVTLPSNEWINFLVSPSNLADRVRVRWIGTSTVTVNDPNQISGLTSGTEGPYKYIEFQVLARTYVPLKISAGYLDFYDAREANRLLSEQYDPTFIADCALLGRVRFMDFQTTNGTTLLPITGSYRPKPTNIFRCQDWGYSFEEAIELARLAGTDAHICIPYLADQTYVDALVAYAASRLPAASNLYVETSNEPWNPRFVVYGKMRDDWRASNATTSPGDPNGPGDTYAQQVARTVQHNTWIEAKASQLGLSVGKTGRIRRCLSAQFGAGSNLAILLARPGLSAHCDFIVAAPYLANNNATWQPGYTTADIPTMLELLTTADDGTDAQVRRIVAMKAQVEAAGFSWDTYEMGTHVITGETTVATAFHRDTRLRPIYSYYLREIRKAAPDATFVIFNDFGGSSIFGSWGHRDSQRDTTSPRYLALLDAINGIYTVPALTLIGAPPSGTAGTAYSYQYKKYFGAGVDAPATFAVVAGALPTGNTLSAAGLETGTPEAGTFTYTIRVTDSTGSYDRQYTKTIAAAVSYPYLDDARSVGTLPATGAGSSRTNVRGWTTDFGYATNGAVRQSGYGSDYTATATFGTGINSKDREVIFDIDTSTWSANGAELVFNLARDPSVQSNGVKAVLANTAGSGLQVRTGTDGFISNVDGSTGFDHGAHSFRFVIVGGNLKIYIDGNLVGDSAGYTVGSAYAATSTVSIGMNDAEQPNAVLYKRIGLRAL